MTAPARSTQQPQAQASSVNLSLIDACIARTLETKDAKKRIASFTHGQPYNRITAQVREAMIKVPALMDVDPDSLVDAVVTIQRLQLEIGVTAYLVPFRDKRRGRMVANAVTGYKGKIELLIHNGVCRDVDTHVVYSKEHFRYEQGLNPILEHHPQPPSVRGEPIGAYAIAWLSRSHAKFKFLYLDEIEAIREEFSKQWNREKVGACPPWYMRKTAVNAVVSLLPTSQKLKDIQKLTADDQFFADSTRGALSVVGDRPEDIDDDGVDLSAAEDRGATDEPTPKPEPVASTSADPNAPFCPKCSGDMWDNRLDKKNPRAPDYKCKDKGCDGAIWPPKNGHGNTQGSLLSDPPAVSPQSQGR